MIAVPAVTPVTTPVPATTVAFALPLLHEPVPRSVKVIVPPTQTCVGPEMLFGSGFTVITLVTLHPAAV